LELAEEKKPLAMREENLDTTNQTEDVGKEEQAGHLLFPHSGEEDEPAGSSWLRFTLPKVGILGKRNIQVNYGTEKNFGPSLTDQSQSGRRF